MGRTCCAVRAYNALLLDRANDSTAHAPRAYALALWATGDTRAVEGHVRSMTATCLLNCVRFDVVGALEDTADFARRMRGEGGGSIGGSIILLEPRRLAARAAAHRMASILNERVGETVGYRVRFDSKTSSRTRVEVVTEGVFTRRLQDDPSLPGVSGAF